MSHLNEWKASHILALKFPQIIDGMNVLLVDWRQENEHIMHLRTHAIMEIINVKSSRNIFSTLSWHRCFSMGWKYGVVTSLNLLGKSLKMSKTISLQSFYKLWNRRHTPFSYTNKPLEIVENLNYLGLKVPSNHRQNGCATRRLEEGKEYVRDMI